MGFKIRDKDQGAPRGSAETQVLSSAKMARMARVDNVFRHIERQARTLIREDIGRGLLAFHDLRAVDAIAVQPRQCCPGRISSWKDMGLSATVAVASSSSTA